MSKATCFHNLSFYFYTWSQPISIELDLSSKYAIDPDVHGECSGKPMIFWISSLNSMTWVGWSRWQKARSAYRYMTSDMQQQLNKFNHKNTVLFQWSQWHAVFLLAENVDKVVPWKSKCRLKKEKKKTARECVLLVH